LAAIQASGEARMKLQLKANRRISNIECRSMELLQASPSATTRHVAQSFLEWTEFIYSTFDVGRSMFDVHQFLFRFDRTLAPSGDVYMKIMV